MELTPLFRKILVEWREQWTPSDIVDREELDKSTLSQGRVRKITTFTGFRRVGKTYLMYQAIDELVKSGIADKNSVFYVNLEDERIPAETKSLTELLPALREIFGEGQHPMYLFLDEVQTIPNWSKWARRVYDSERGRLSLFLSGSSSKLSSHDLPTELRGRCTSIEVFPLSLKGFLKFRGLEADFANVDYSDREKAKLLGLLREFLVFGGLPEVVLSEGEKRKLLLLQEYYKTVVRRDIAERHKIRNISLLSDFLRLLLNSTHISISKMCNVLKSSGHKVSKNTLINYLRYSEEAYFAFVLHIFSRKVKDQMLYPKKVYFIDNGFISALSLKFSENMGRLVENAVAVELKRRNSHNPLAELSYWRAGHGGDEVDFVIRDGGGVRQLVQACYDVGDPDTKNRELKGLITASKELKCDNLLVITWDYEAEEKLDEGKKITYVPLCKWLLAGPG